MRIRSEIEYKVDQILKAIENDQPEISETEERTLE